jgi:hypothetical protein
MLVIHDESVPSEPACNDDDDDDDDAMEYEHSNATLLKYDPDGCEFTSVEAYPSTERGFVGGRRSHGFVFGW